MSTRCEERGERCDGVGDGSLHLEVDRPSRVHAWKILFGAVLFFSLLLVGTYYFFLIRSR